MPQYGIKNMQNWKPMKTDQERKTTTVWKLESQCTRVTGLETQERRFLLQQWGEPRANSLTYRTWQFQGLEIKGMS
jgi:hypothetical protein